MTTLDVIEADITTLALDAIVNAANTSLLGGGGVDGAIHHRAGRGLVDECRMLRGCHVGDAKLTGGHALPARFVIHTVGPKWQDGTHGEPAALASCYRRALEVARTHRAPIRTLAFPAISTGIYGYPPAAAARVAVATVRAEVAAHPDAFDRIVFCMFGADAAAAMHAALAQ